MGVPGSMMNNLGQRVAEGALIAGVSVGGTYGLLEHRIGSLERSLDRATAVLVSLQVEGRRLDVIDAHLAGVAARVAELERATPRRWIPPPPP